MRRAGVTWCASAALLAACGSGAGHPRPDAGACSTLTIPTVDGGPDGTSRYFPPTRFALGPIYGTGCPDFGGCESGGTATSGSLAAVMAGEVEYQLDQLAANDIPITMYHFDGWDWSDSRDCTFSAGDAVKARLAAGNIRALLHFWGGCTQSADFDRVYAQLGPTLGGFYLDEGSTDDLAKTAIDWAQSQLPGDSEIVMKGFQGDNGETDAGLAAYGHTSYVNDLPSDFGGFKTGVERVFSLANTLPAPFNEFTGYDAYNRPDEETFFRRIHFGAMQVVMDHSPWLHASPWNAVYSQALLDDYRYFAWLHRELGPYLHSYDWNAYETGEPIFRGADATAYTTKIGDEIFVAYVTDRVADRPLLDVALPPGEWIDYWDTRDVVSGTLSGQAPSLGREPIFIANGAIIPMDVSRPYTRHGTAASAGSLTVVVYPKGDSSFRYRDDEANRWIVFSAHQTADRLELSASAGLSQPVLYRVERLAAPPSAVGICGAAVIVNGGGGAAAAASEDAVNGSSSPAWFYDAAAQRLIVKALP